MERYDSYKDSGVDWIGEIPSHWRNKKIWTLFRPVSRKNTEGEVNLSVYRDYGVIPRDSRDDNHNRVSEDTSNYKLVEVGDFVLNKMKCWMGSLGLSDYRGIVSPSYTVLTPLTGDNHKFLHFLLRSNVYIPEYRRLSYGVRIGQWDLRFEDFRDIPTVIPPLHEQEQIVGYLDRKTTLIDSLIEKTVRKIELLKEKRTSLINEVVTKGLNPDVEMKDSGVEWIGEIPSHWGVRKGSTLGTFSKGNGIKKDEVTSEGIPCVRYGELYTIYDHKVTQTVSFVKDNIGVPIEYGTLLMTGSGELVEDIGKCVVYTGEGHIRVGGDLIILVPNVDFNPLFLSYLMNSESIRIQREMSGRGGIIVHIYSKNFKDMKFSTPPIHEQEQIVEYLDEQTSIIDSTITTEEKRIELLKEYRQSMISEVVTGKCRVS